MGAGTIETMTAQAEEQAVLAAQQAAAEMQHTPETVPTGHPEIHEQSKKALQDAIRTGTCPYLNQVVEMAAQNQPEVREAIMNDDTDALIALARQKAAARAAAKEVVKPETVVPKETDQAIGRRQLAAQAEHVLWENQLQAQEAENSAVQTPDSEPDVPKAVSDSVVPHEKSVLKPVIEAQIPEEIRHEVLVEDLRVSEEPGKPIAPELEVLDTPEAVEIQRPPTEVLPVLLAETVDEVSDVIALEAEPQLAASEFEIEDVDVDPEVSPLFIDVIAGEADVIEQADSVVDLAAETPMVEVVEPEPNPAKQQLVELVQETVSEDEQPAAQKLLDQIETLLGEELKEQAELAIEADAVESTDATERIEGLEAAELSPEIEVLIEELAARLPEVEPEEIRRFVLQMKVELEEKATESALIWRDDIMHEISTDAGAINLNFRDLMHSLLGRLAIHRKSQLTA